jgi:hypothetical protein
MTTAGAHPQQPPDPDLSALRAGAIRVAAETCHLTRRRQADPAAAGAGLGEAAACTARALAGIAGPLAGMIASHDPRRAGQLGGLAAALADAAGRYTGQGQHDITACAALFGLLGPATILTGRALQSARARGTATPRPDLAVNGARCAPGAPRPDDGHWPSALPGGACRHCGGAVARIRWSETAGLTAVIHVGEITAIYDSYGQQLPGTLTGDTDQALDELLSDLRAAGRHRGDGTADRCVEQVTVLTCGAGGGQPGGGH